MPSTGGNVGIGTTSPTEKFHIQDTRSTANSIGMYVVKPIAVVGISYGSYVATSGASTTNIGGYFTASGATNNYALIVPSTGGNVGIGTTSPLTKLQIETSSTSTTLGSDFAQFPILLKNTSATDNNFTNILFRNSGATAVASMGVQVTSHASSTADILFATRGATFSEKMRITSAGNVGIGTATPTAVLHLKAGTATASTAPLKFTSQLFAALLTAPEAGAVEFSVDTYYGTITTGAARKTFAFLESPLFTGTPTLPTGTIAVTQAANTNNTTVATTAYVDRTQIFSTSLSLTSAQILALNTTPITIVSAPGASKYIEVISATGEYTFVTAAYATNTTLQLIYTGATRYIGYNGAILTGTVDLIYQFNVGPLLGAATTATQVLTNTALQVKVETGNPTGGSGTVKVKVLYRIVTL